MIINNNQISYIKGIKTEIDKIIQNVVRIIRQFHGCCLTE